jgi:hypothetical protein
MNKCTAKLYGDIVLFIFISANYVITFPIYLCTKIFLVSMGYHLLHL